jgi:hypothetical protein
MGIEAREMFTDSSGRLKDKIMQDKTHYSYKFAKKLT